MTVTPEKLEIKELLENRFPFFEQELKDEIVEIGKVKDYENGDLLINSGDFIKSFPLLAEGLIKIFRMDDDSNELLLYFLKPGESCSMALTCCMSDIKSNIEAEAVESSKIIAIPVVKIEQWISKYPTWKTFVFYSYRKRFDELLDTIDSIAFMKMDERLVRFFNQFYESTGSKIYCGSHQDIAYSLNTSREVISRLLKVLENQEKLMLSRGKIDFSALV